MNPQWDRNRRIGPTKGKLRETYGREQFLAEKKESGVIGKKVAPGPAKGRMPRVWDTGCPASRVAKE